ncbi:hypothetical protein [Streptomyces sp. NPDC048155]|uniref:hypothetical protein n=1 Tax=unclassified Streptomyces TaxID=2593676 RepID=UPI0033F9D030
MTGIVQGSAVFAREVSQTSSVPGSGGPALRKDGEATESTWQTTTRRARPVRSMKRRTRLSQNLEKTTTVCTALSSQRRTHASCTSAEMAGTGSEAMRCPTHAARKSRWNTSREAVTGGEPVGGPQP